MRHGQRAVGCRRQMMHVQCIWLCMTACAVLNTLPYVFFHSYPTFGLLFNCVLCFTTIDGATHNLEYCFDNAVNQMPFNTFKCTKRTMVLYSIWMTEPLPGKSKENMAQSLVHKFHPISATLSAHLCGINHK